MGLIFVITNHKSWETAKAQGEHRSDSLQSEGFIHCSQRLQVLAVAEKRFKGQTGLLLLVIDESKLAAKVKYEGAKDNLFPHIYGPLNIDAVQMALPFSEGKKGFEFPNMP